MDRSEQQGGEPKRLGGFEILGQLGKGGMGTVYKARQVSLNRPVALKILPKALATNQDFVKRFIREARSAATLHHPNIVQAIDVGIAEGYYYFAMEYVDGEGLDAVLRREVTLEQTRAAGIMEQVCSALAAAHEAGIVHRDIKPSNIMFDSKGQVRVTDFGLAKRIEGDISVTADGQALGTPAYVAPEMAKGGEADARSDLYSLGATMFHALAGRPPFVGKSFSEVLIKQATEPPPVLSSLAPRVDRRLCHIIDRLLRKNPDGRYPSAKALLDDLQGLGALQTVAGPAPSQHRAAMADAPTLALAEGKGRERQAVAKAHRRPQRLKTDPTTLLVAGGVLTLLAALIVLVVTQMQAGGPTAARPSVQVEIPRAPEESRKPAVILESKAAKREVPPSEIAPATSPKDDAAAKARQGQDAEESARFQRIKAAAAKAAAIVAYDNESGKIWAFLKSRQYDEAGKLVAESSKREEFKAAEAYVKADAEAIALLKDLWAAAEAGLAASKGQMLLVGGAAGTIDDAKDGVITIRTSEGKTEERKLIQLGAKQAIHYAGVKDKADTRSKLMAGIFLLAEGVSPDEARDALAKAGEGPSVAVYKARLETLLMGTGEAAAKTAWLGIQEEAKGKLSRAAARHLTNLLADFEKKHGDTRFYKGLGDQLAELNERIASSTGPTVYTKWPFDEAEAKRRQEETAKALAVKVEQDIDLGGGVKMTIVLTPAGEFLMGSSPTTSPEKLEKLYGKDPWGHYQDEFPQHRVKISRPFWLGKFHVTQEQWQAISGNNPNKFPRKPQNPVEQVSWDDCQGFLQKLSAKLKKTFRLPTEAQWEYACRAGTATEFYFGNDAAKVADFGWVGVNSTAPVGMKKPNAWGLFDMAGNVWEWCGDWFGKYDGGAQTDPNGAPAGEGRVLRGGSWCRFPSSCRSAFRFRAVPWDQYVDLGCRVVLRDF